MVVSTREMKGLQTPGRPLSPSGRRLVISVEPAWVVLAVVNLSGWADVLLRGGAGVSLWAEGAFLLGVEQIEPRKNVVAFAEPAPAFFSIKT